MNEEYVKIKNLAHNTISTAELADWLDTQPEKWWSVDGEFFLMSVLDFPCPTDELSPVIRGLNKTALVHNPVTNSHGEKISRDQLSLLGNTHSRSKRPIYAMSWDDSDEVWLLMEDRPLEG